MRPLLARVRPLRDVRRPLGHLRSRRRDGLLHAQNFQSAAIEKRFLAAASKSGANHLPIPLHRLARSWCSFARAAAGCIREERDQREPRQRRTDRRSLQVKKISFSKSLFGITFDCCKRVVFLDKVG